MENRRVPRFPLEIRASYQFESDPRTFRSATMLNVSPGGFAFYADRRIEIGERINLNVRLDGEESVSLLTEVVWSRKIGDSGRYLCGVKLLDDEGSSQRAQLTAYCGRMTGSR